MKKHFLYLASLLLSVLVISCSEQQELSVRTNGVSFTIDKFVEDTPSSLATKTSVDPSNNFAITWANGDTVGIFPLEGFQEPFKIPANQVGQSSVSFNGGYWQIKDGLSYNAYYPFSTKNFKSSDMVTKIPVTYVGQYQNGHGCNAGAYDYTYSDWSTASMGNVNFAFHHLGSFLVLSLPLPATATYTQLTLQSSSANLPTKGTYDLTAATPSFMADANSLSSTLEMELIDFSGTKDEVAVFYMMIPPMDLTGSTVRVTLTAENGSCSYTLDNMSRVFQAGKLYRRTGTLVDTSVTGTVDPWEDEDDDTPAYEYVDLGLPSKTLWATFNIGATKPEEYGDYFAWGATEPWYETGYAQDGIGHWKSNIDGGYTWNHTPYQTASISDFAFNIEDTKWTKYLGSVTTSYKDPSAIDANAVKIVLDPEDDAAHVNWGEDWRMPTVDEWAELVNEEYCSLTWTTLHGINGYEIRSKVVGYTDNWIFLPAASYRNGGGLGEVGMSGHYWSSSMIPLDPAYAAHLLFSSDECILVGSSRNAGCSVRPVRSDVQNCGITGISLDKTSASVTVGSIETLTATVESNAGSRNTQVEWSSSNTSVATVDYSGKVTAISAGTTTITAKTVFGGFTASCTVTVTPVYEYVDLGLSVKWATMNVGANAPEEYGDYFAWGETEPYYEAGWAQENPQAHWKDGKSAGYNWSTYKYCKGSYNTMTKYSTDGNYGSNGFTDYKTVLDLEDDAAHVNWGGNWRMPTYMEQDELLNNCTWTWTTLNGVNGYKVQSNKPGYTDNWIFLPAANYRIESNLTSVGWYGMYWSCSLTTDDPLNAYGLSFYSGGVGWSDLDRSWGRSVRPVCP